MIFKNKEIHRLDLAITTNCILRCKYCFVRKNKKVINYKIAKKTISSFLATRGKEKILVIYGGEPLLCFNLIKKIIDSSQIRARKLKKHLIISVGTNGVLLSQPELSFFQKRNIKISISMDGQKKFHDKARVFKNQKGSFNRISRQLPLIFQTTNKENICILFGVLPSSAHKIYDNLFFLFKLGFNCFNIEPVQSIKYYWGKEQKIFFLCNMVKLITEIYNNIFIGNFIFLNSVSRELKNRELSVRKKTCPFFKNLQVYPNGEMAFSPFLINSKFRKRYIIGNIKKGIEKKYLFCKYGLKKEKCNNCWSEYCGIGNEDIREGQDMVMWRNRYSVYLARKILEQSKNNALFKKYISESKKRIFE